MTGNLNCAMEQELVGRIKNAESLDEVKGILNENGLNADEVIAAAEKMNQEKADDQELEIFDLEQVTGGFAITTAVALFLGGIGMAFVGAGIYGAKKQKTKTTVCTQDANGDWSNCKTTYK